MSPKFRLPLFLLLVFALVPPVYALGPARGDRIGILDTDEQYAGRVERMIAAAMPRILVEELRRVGFDARLLTSTVEEFPAHTSEYDFLVEVVFEQAEAGYGGGVGAGVPVGAVAVGAEVSMAYAAIDARVNLYDAESRSLLKTFRVQARTASPTVTGVGVGHREGFLFVHLPLRARYPHKRVARAVARDAAARIVAQ